MVIDEDNSKWSIGSDYVFIQLTLDFTHTQHRKLPPKKFFNIIMKTDWKKYRKALEPLLQHCKTEMIAAGDDEEVEIPHTDLQVCITTAAKKERKIKTRCGSYRCLPIKLKRLVKDLKIF